MKLWRKKGDRVLLVGIFQSSDTGRAVLKNLYRAGFRRIAAINASAGGTQVVKHSISAIGGAAAAAAVFVLVTGALVFWQRGTLARYGPAMLALLLAAFALAGGVWGGGFCVVVFSGGVVKTNVV